MPAYDADRYSRQTRFPPLGSGGQERLTAIDRAPPRARRVADPSAVAGASIARDVVRRI